MKNIIRGIVSLFWLIATGFLAFMVYVIFQTETNQQSLWGWMTLCGLTFVSATFLAYTALFGGHQDDHAHEG